MQVEKPARYIGNEINMVVKDPNVHIRFAFCFPDVYEVGMSHLGLQILYFFLNRRTDTYCERVFAPWVDMEGILRKKNIPLFALETGDPVKDFDILGFTLQYEMSYTNIINILDLSGISLFSRDRGEGQPIVCAGGPCACNPEPLADIIDFFYIGEGEVMLDTIMEIYKENKSNGGGKEKFLELLLTVEGVYVPKFYDTSYHKDGRIKAFTPSHPLAPQKIKKVSVADLDAAFYPDAMLTPLIETVHDRVALEVFRGCTRGCRFCQAGYIYRPKREKHYNTLLSQCDSLISSTGQEEISLVSLSTGDYTGFAPLAQGLIDKFAGQHVNLSLPSLRIDAFSLDIMEKIQSVRKSSLTFAPEAGSQRMRDVINKGISAEEIINGCRLAFAGGWDKIKLYFMIGLPSETEDDLLAIVRLSEQIVDEYYKLPLAQRKRPVSVGISVSCFVPKPFTPFQWEQQDSYESFMDKQKFIKKNIFKKQIKYHYHDARLSVWEGVLARGDRRTGAAIVAAWRLGARFDGWTDHFNHELWEKAFTESGLCPSFYTARIEPMDALLPWDHIDIGIRRQHLQNEAEKAYAVSSTCEPSNEPPIQTGGYDENEI